MSLTDLTTLAADCEARAKAGEKPVHPGWVHNAKDRWTLHVIPLQSDEDTQTFAVHIIRFSTVNTSSYFVFVGVLGSVRGLDISTESLAGSMLFAEALLREATAPLHADKAVLMQTIRERDRMIGEMDERTRVCDTEQGRRIVEQLDRIAALESALAEATAPKLRPMSEAPRDRHTRFLVLTNPETDRARGEDGEIQVGSPSEWKIGASDGETVCTQDGDERPCSDFAGWLPLPVPPEVKK